MYYAGVTSPSSHSTRPLVTVAVSFWTGVLLAGTESFSSIHLVAASFVAIAGQPWLPGLRRMAHLPIFLIFAVTGAVLWDLNHTGPPGDGVQRFILDYPAETEARLTGRVERPDIILDADDYAQFVLRVNEVVVGG